MNWFTIVFVATLAAGTLLQLWLARRQQDAVRTHRDRVPTPFARHISLQAHTRAADYTLARLAVERWDIAVSALVLLAWTLGGGLQWLAGQIQALPLPGLWPGLLLVLAVLLINGLIDLPLRIWSTFGIEERFGFNRTTPARFVRDRLLGAALLVLLGTPLLLAILWLMRHAGSTWWLAVWGVWMGFTLLLSWIFPTWIAPLFNRFEPLADGPLKQRLEALLTRCGFHSRGMYVMDGSSRSSHGNAYFTGFGRNKRIVFYDTLLDGLGEPQVEAVLAHELGHFRHHHVIRMLALSGVLSLAGLALLAWLLHQDWFHLGLGVNPSGPAVSLVLFILVLPAFSLFVSPLLSLLSRRHEFQADAFSAQQTSANDLIDGLLSVYRDNASTLTPDHLYSAFHHSHPPAAERIARLLATDARTGATLSS